MVRCGPAASFAGEVAGTSSSRKETEEFDVVAAFDV
jgi:hypothetical protein